MYRAGLRAHRWLVVVMHGVVCALMVDDGRVGVGVQVEVVVMCSLLMSAAYPHPRKGDGLAQLAGEVQGCACSWLGGSHGC